MDAQKAKLLEKQEARYNHLRKLNALIAAGLIPMPQDKGRPEVVHIYVEHEDRCKIFKNGKRCNCDPDIRLNGVRLELPLNS